VFPSDGSQILSTLFNSFHPAGQISGGCDERRDVIATFGGLKALAGGNPAVQPDLSQFLISIETFFPPKGCIASLGESPQKQILASL
jgi:hypothetical protein